MYVGIEVFHSVPKGDAVRASLSRNARAQAFCPGGHSPLCNEAAHFHDSIGEEPDRDKRVFFLLSYHELKCIQSMTDVKSLDEARFARNGDWPNARPVPDAYLGVIRDGTSNIECPRSCGREGWRAQVPARGYFGTHGKCGRIVRSVQNSPGGRVSEAFSFAEGVAKKAHYERFNRVAAGKLYHALTAVLLAAEGGQSGLHAVTRHGW